MEGVTGEAEGESVGKEAGKPGGEEVEAASEKADETAAGEASTAAEIAAAASTLTRPRTAGECELHLRVMMRRKAVRRVVMLGSAAAGFVSCVSAIYPQVISHIQACRET